MLEIRRGSAARSYENTFFREFVKNLQILFDKYSIDGLLIANSECEISPNLQIDSLLITKNAICLIDLKNFGGDIILPQADTDFSEGQWVTQGGVRIKGGSHINPYKQLFQQKKAFTWVFHNSAIKSSIISSNEELNPSHVKKIICFQKPIKLKGEVPGRDEIDFFITDSESYLETIKDILDIDDKEVKLSKKSFDIFKEIFRAETFSPAEQYNKPEILESTSTILNFDGLYPDQKSALQEITEFIKSDTDKIFILQGTSLSGKSYLLPFIEDAGFNNNITQIEFFASSSRVASNLLSESNTQFNSLYSYIYGGGLQEEQDDNEPVNENDSFDKIKLEVVPLKKNEDENKALFVVDEAQLISDNYHQSIDLRFGSGKLLEDFIKFSDLSNSNRKIIFIGDRFQLSMGKKEESALNPSYFDERYKLATKAFQLVDKDDISSMVKQALIPVNGIRNHNYNQLSFEISDNLKVLEKNKILSIVEEKIKNNSNFHLLSYSNFDAQKINLWIKQSILKNGEYLAENDLVIINNNFKIEEKNNPFSEQKKIYNGQFGTVSSVGNVISEVITPKGKKPVTINFRYVGITLNDTSHNATILSLENYRLSEKGELSEDEIIALKIILNREVNEKINKNPFEKSELQKQLIHSKKYNDLSKEVEALKDRLENGEKVKTKLEEKEGQVRKLINSTKRQHRKNIEKELFMDTSSKYKKYKNCAHLRYGWALTVHKSMSYKWDEVLFNVYQGENRGKTNEGYFKWIYTGLTRAKDNVELINYRPITPLLKIEFKDSSTGSKVDKKIYFIVDKDVKPDIFSTTLIKKFNFTEDKTTSILMQLHQFVSNKLEHQGISIKSIDHPNYQEIYELEGDNKQTAKVSIYYNNKGHVKVPTLMKAETKQFGTEVMEAFMSDSGIIDFGFISDDWRRRVYADIYSSFKDDGYKIAHIIQTPYKDTIKIIQNESSLVVDMYYDGDGFFSSIISTYYSDIKVWDYYQSTLKALQ
ncbi:hypothetical protein BJAS_P4503 [Bathymodiolus japonicus methanotrophic gill symbiont]|uniref:NERD domain-containing protein/DEAD/DEAH box helicase n=1 Tax=Bathymodiolus japonicus methanotrophic gill symbiont TaxID=113269 RepID=UPI001B65AAF9|nr:NERD domain-containing protein/DEAD/DEAH box helicase [Bathymodiolus japonicus methanotrophic gill symbiont]GFO73603.1 hypothetical protein BJAS_P4503 [Bathymodiolus japonicus methanotrophic gill symbiont]